MMDRKKGVRHFKLGGIKKPFTLHSIVDQFEAQKRKERLRRSHHVRTIQKPVISGIMYETEIWTRKKRKKQ